MKLRRPHENEALDCGKLIHMSGPHLFSYIYGEEAPQIYDLFASLINKKGNTFSQKNITVVEADGNLAALMAAYPFSLAKEYTLRELRYLKERKGGLVPFAGPFLKMAWRTSLAFYYPRIKDDELFITSLAVFPQYRRKGISRLLLNRAETIAREKGLNKISLYVEIDNEHAIRAYERAGFYEAGKSVFPKRYRRKGLQGFFKMLKEIL